MRHGQPEAPLNAPRPYPGLGCLGGRQMWHQVPSGAGRPGRSPAERTHGELSRSLGRGPSGRKKEAQVIICLVNPGVFSSLHRLQAPGGQHPACLPDSPQAPSPTEGHRVGGQAPGRSRGSNTGQQHPPGTPKGHTHCITKSLHRFRKSKQHGQQNLSALAFQTLPDSEQEGQTGLPGPDMPVASDKEQETMTSISRGSSAVVLESDWWGTRVSCVDHALSVGGIYRERDQPAVLEAQGSPMRPE